MNSVVVRFVWGVVGLVLAVFCAGCERSQHNIAAAQPEELNLFERGRGLRLPEETRASLGVELTEVVEKRGQRGPDAVCVAVPATAVIHTVGGPFVYVVNGDYFTRTEIKTGAASGDWVEVTDGLYAGDIVVSEGAEAMWMVELFAVRGGTPCCPVPKKTASAK